MHITCMQSLLLFLKFSLLFSTCFFLFNPNAHVHFLTISTYIITNVGSELIMNDNDGDSSSATR